MLKRILTISLLAFLFMSCSSKKFITYYSDLNKYSLNKHYKDAVNLVEKSNKPIYGKRNELLYFLDKGYFLHLNGEYEKSNEAFTNARKIYEDQYTKSVTNRAASLATNDSIQPYYGDPFELSLLFMFKALNYLKLDDPNSSAVEARASTYFLRILNNEKYSKDVYKDDAFIHYINGLIFEINKDYNDAFTSYRKALQLYNSRYFNFNPPQDLYNSAINMAKILGFNEEIDQLAKNFTYLAKNYTPPVKKSSELIILHYNGLVPHREATTIEVSFGEAWMTVNAYKAESAEDKDVETASKAVHSILSSDQVIVSVPTYVKTPYNIYSAEISLNSNNLALQKSTDLGNITLENFKDEKTGIYAKAMARAAIKFAIVKSASNVAEEKLGALGGFVVKAGLRTTSSLTEDADIRSWRVIPDEIKMARIPVDEGNYTLTIKYKTKSGFEKTETKEVNVRKGKKEFLILHTIE